MKRFWIACFAITAATLMVSNAYAQFQSPEIGSYQSILSRTGYGSSPVGGAVGTIPGALPGQLADAVPQVVAPSSPVGSQTREVLGSQTRESLGSHTREPAGSHTRQVAPATSYAPQASYAPQGSYLPQPAATCNGNCGGGAVSSGPIVSSGASYGAAAPVISSAPIYGGATPCSGGNCGGGGCADGSCGGGIASYADYGASTYSAPVYTPGASVGAIVESAPDNNTINRVGGFFGVVFRRNYADPVRLGSNNGRDIFSDDIDHGDFTGQGIFLAGRKANGNGREIIYWGLDDDSTFNFASPDFVSIRQLDDLQLGGQVLNPQNPQNPQNPVSPPVSPQSVLSYLNSAGALSVFRDTEINNIEVNLLRNGGHYYTRHGKAANFELLGGLRLFQFDESLRLVGFDGPESIEYRLEADNFLVGAQLGCRNEVCLTQRLRLSSGINVGLFNNRSETRQQVFDQDGTFATLTGGQAIGQTVGSNFDYTNEHDDVAILGEFRLGLIFQLTDRFRSNVGYRALGVSGVALAEDQIPLNILDAGLLKRANTNGSLLLHGFYFGSEVCF